MANQRLSVSGDLIETGLTARTAAQRATFLAAMWASFTSPQKAAVGAAIGLTPAEISGLAANIATWLGAPSSANLAAAITDETGTGVLVFGTSPSLTTPAFDGETYSTAVTVTAGTNAQGQSALTKDVNVITTAAANPSGVTLPTATAGRMVTVVNKGANPVAVFPASGAAIDGLSANASISLAVGSMLEFFASSATQWYSTTNSAAATSALTGTLAAAQEPAHTGDATNSAGSLALTLATVNGNVGSFGLAASVAQLTVNAKGLITAIANVAIAIASTAITDLATAIMTLSGTQTVTGDKTYTGAQVFRRNKFTIQDNVDNTKAIDFTVASVTTGTTRTFNWPDLSGSPDVVVTGGAQTITGNKTFSGNNSFIDNNWTLLDDGDATKILKFDCATIGSGVTRTATMPNASGTLVLSSNTQTLTGKTLTAPIVTVTTVAGLGTATAGARGHVSDSLAAPVFNATLTGGGAVSAPVWADGSVWRYG